jgi:IMP dehydrogenase
VEGKEVVGIITNRDLRFERELDAEVRAKMTPREKLVYVKEGADAPRRSQAPDEQAPPGARAGGQRRV